ncbi:MAG: hypothetical protein H6711_08020 [Myxococcales bacterium]|nr:hypothetical protein [Myxococcales bacterium]
MRSPALLVVLLVGAACTSGEMSTASAGSATEATTGESSSGAMTGTSSTTAGATTGCGDIFGSNCFSDTDYVCSDTKCVDGEWVCHCMHVPSSASEPSTSGATTASDTTTATDGTTAMTDATTAMTDVTTGGDTDSTTGGGAVEYHAFVLIGGLDRVVVRKLDDDAGRCTELRLYSPVDVAMWPIMTPKLWQVEAASISDQVAPCLTNDPLDTPVWATNGAGVVDWPPLDPNMIFPCEIDVDVTLDFDDPQPWVPAADAMQVMGLAVDGC